MHLAIFKLFDKCETADLFELFKSYRSSLVFFFKVIFT
jgi:hypothetical protein